MRWPRLASASANIRYSFKIHLLAFERYAGALRERSPMTRLSDPHLLMEERFHQVFWLFFPLDRLTRSPGALHRIAGAKSQDKRNESCFKRRQTTVVSVLSDLRGAHCVTATVPRLLAPQAWRAGARLG